MLKVALTRLSNKPRPPPLLHFFPKIFEMPPLPPKDDEVQPPGNTILREVFFCVWVIALGIVSMPFISVTNNLIETYRLMEKHSEMSTLDVFLYQNGVSTWLLVDDDNWTSIALTATFILVASVGTSYDVVAKLAFSTVCMCAYIFAQAIQECSLVGNSSFFPESTCEWVAGTSYAAKFPEVIDRLDAHFRIG